MTTPRAAVQTAKTIRLIHASLITGLLLLFLVTHFILRRTLTEPLEISTDMLHVLLGAALAGCALSLLLRRRVPQRATDESKDLFWTRAATPALIMWASLEAPCLLAILLYMRTGSQSAIGVAAIAAVLFVILNPAFLERQSR